MPDSYIDKKGYARIKIKPAWEDMRKNVKLHRIAYLLYYKPPVLEESMSLSHLCHQKACINAEHLSQEPLATNIQRNNCIENGHCFGHTIYPNCIIP
jgi:hypothetical protein